MVEDDTFTYHVKQQSADRVNTAVHCLITKERTQKLDLLIHLLSNLTQALIVCGPQGIGKTTLLTILQQRKTESWRYCLVQGNADVSFETMQEQLAQTVSPGKSAQSLSMALGQYEDQHKQVVLIVDNAGELVPGLISAIIQYAAANSVLRVIFALTHDELQMKRGSDRAVDDCHIVEIPTLSEKQCGDFLQHLSTNPALSLSFKAITDNMIAHIYRETHGVPGRIVAELSGLSGVKQGGKLKWLLVFGVATLCAIVFGVQWRAASKNSNKKVIAPVVEQKTDAIKTETPRPEAQIMLTLPPVQPVILQQELLEPALLEASREEPRQPVVEEQVETEVTPILKNKSQSEPVSAAKIDRISDNKQSDDTQAKMAERLGEAGEKLKQAELKATVKSEESAVPSANNFTLQLMVLSKQASVNGILKKYPAMSSGFRAVKTVVNGQEKFILEYGSYPDAASANKARQSLPSEFSNAMVRKVSPIKNR